MKWPNKILAKIFQNRNTIGIKIGQAYYGRKVLDIHSFGTPFVLFQEAHGGVYHMSLEGFEKWVERRAFQLSEVSRNLTKQIDNLVGDLGNDKISGSKFFSEIHELYEIVSGDVALLQQYREELEERLIPGPVLWA